MTHAPVPTAGPRKQIPISNSPGAISTNQGEVFRRNPYSLRGRQLFYSAAIGTDELMADVILDQVAAAPR